MGAALQQEKENMEEVAIHAKYSKSIFESERMMVAIYKGIGEEAYQGYFKVTGSNLITNRPCVLMGEWKQHQKYGKSFVVRASEDLPAPDAEEGFAAYLKDMRLKGVGEKTAKRIVEMYGADTLSVMDDPEKLAKVKGISASKAAGIAKEWRNREGLRRYYDFFVEVGLPSAKCANAYMQMEKEGYGIDDVRQNPYLLCHCERLSFTEVDEAVMRLPDGGYFYECRDRVFHGLLHCMMKAEQQGHTFSHYRPLSDQAMKLLFPGDPGKNLLVRYYFIEMVRDGELVYDKEHDAIYREHTYKSEKGCAELLGSLLFSHRKNNDPEKVQKLIQAADPNRTLSGKQKEAVQNAFLQNVSIITGGPGMGKTYCLKAVLAVASKLAKEKGQELSIALCAPTGRAARKMEENASFPASTIHHPLRLTDDGVFAGQPEPVDADMVVVDEFSMVGIDLFYSLLRCIRPGTALVIIGDKDQLPSVPCGDVLNDMIRCGVIPVTVLDKIFRQEEGCSIIENAYAVNHFSGDGRSLQSTEHILKVDGDTAYIPVKDDRECLEKVLEAAKAEAAKYGTANVQVLTPLRKRSEACARVLNVKLQELFNPHAENRAELKRVDTVFREGDRVMQLKNVTVDDVYYSNGDIGTISKILEREKTVWVRYDENRVRAYEGSELDELEHAFAMTVHKAQGSEFDSVILPFIDEFAGMRKKKILYTAMTRAKKKLTIVGDGTSVPFALEGKEETRNSLFGWRLAQNVQSRSILKNSLSRNRKGGKT